MFGPLLGALVVKTLGELGKAAAGDAPGLDLVIYGCVLILVVAVAPRGIAGILSGLRHRMPSRVLSTLPRLRGREAKGPAPLERNNG